MRGLDTPSWSAEAYRARQLEPGAPTSILARADRRAHRRRRLPGLNAVIRAVVRKGIDAYGDQLVGFRDGWRGVLEDRSWS